MQSLQIKFSFSIPSHEAIKAVCDLKLPIVSAGAGTGYWEFLFQKNGIKIVSFDQNLTYPEEMRFIYIEVSVLVYHCGRRTISPAPRYSCAFKINVKSCVW